MTIALLLIAAIAFLFAVFLFYTVINDISYYGFNIVNGFFLLLSLFLFATCVILFRISFGDFIVVY